MRHPVQVQQTNAYTQSHVTDGETEAPQKLACDSLGYIGSSDWASFITVSREGFGKIEELLL